MAQHQATRRRAPEGVPRLHAKLSAAETACQSWSASRLQVSAPPRVQDNIETVVCQARSRSTLATSLDWQLSSESGPSESDSATDRSSGLQGALGAECTHELGHERTPLERGSLAALAAKRYHTSCTGFYNIALDEAPEVDAALVEYMNVEFLGSQQLWGGEVLISALCFLHPLCAKLGNQKTPRAWKCTQGWRQLAPSRSRRPYPFILRKGFAMDFIRRNQLQMAVCVMVTPSGNFGGPDWGICDRWCLLVPRQVVQNELLLLKPVTIKTGQADGSLVVDSSGAQKAQAPRGACGASTDRQPTGRGCGARLSKSNDAEARMTRHEKSARLAQYSLPSSFFPITTSLFL